MFDLALRSANDSRAMMTSCVLIFVAFAVAHIAAIMYPPKDGQSQKVARTVGAVCIAAIFILVCWFLYAAHDSVSLFTK